MKTHLNVTSLSILALGVLTSGLVACANDSAQDDTETTGEQAASITARGIHVDGCGGNAVFNVASSSNFAKEIDFIAIDQSEFSELTSQLSVFNEQRQQTLVSNSAETLQASLQTLINEFTSNTTARQASLIRLKEHESANSRTSLTETVFHSDRTVVTTDIESELESSRSGSASNQAVSKNTSFNFNLAKADLETNNRFSNSASEVAFAGGTSGVTAVPIALGVATITAPFFSSSAFTSNSGSTSSSVRSVNENTNSAFNLVASNNETSFSDFVRQKEKLHTSTEIENEFTKTLESETNDAFSRDFLSEAELEAEQSAFVRNESKSASRTKAETHVAFQSLSELKAKTFQLNVNMQTASSRAHTLRVFVGANDQITAMREFFISFPSCGFVDP